jgi:hypothetical protein
MSNIKSKLTFDNMQNAGFKEFDLEQKISYLLSRIIENAPLNPPKMINPSQVSLKEWLVH